MSEDFFFLERPYLLVVHIPYYEDEDGSIWLEQLWHHDLVEHLSYLKNFTLCAPRFKKGATPGLARLEAPPGTRLSIVPLPPQTSTRESLRNLPQTAAALWRAIGDADIVHSSVVGWPYPLGWLTNPIALLRRKHLLVVVEGSWVRSGKQKTLKDRLIERTTEVVGRWSCNRADVCLFTQPGYRELLFTHGRGAAYITPAVWVREEDILDGATAEQLWSVKVREPVRLLFAGRLVVGKGVDVLLSALCILDARGVPVTIDIIGSGDRREAFVQAQSAFKSVRLSVLDPVPYGAPFMKLIDGYHALVISSLGDEQPRVLFDGSARAVASLASDTDGLRAHVEHGKTGWMLPVGNPDAWATAIERLSADAPLLRDMGMAAHRATAACTHRAMHRTRSNILREHFA